ncbi:MAG: PaaI family thioesterase [Myxococcales bacterium]
MAKQPNSRHCFICGVENPVGLKLVFHEPQQGVVECRFTVADHFQSYPGVLHGGVVATILDETCARVYLGDPASPRTVFTAKLEVKYRKHVPLGRALKVVGKALPQRGLALESWAGIYDESAALLAEARAMLVDGTDKASQADRDAIGWTLLPDDSV